MEILVLDSFRDNPSNPARTDMRTGVIEVNREVFSLLPEYTKKFVIYHEIGHYMLQTYDERKADDYALNKMALKDKYSLKHHIDSVYMMARDDVRRKRHALISVLTVLANIGDSEAIELLKNNK